MASRSRLFSKIAKDVGSDGNLTAAALSPDVSFGATVYDSTGVLPYIGNDTGDQAYVRSNNRFYIWDSSGWYNVALINRAPTITSVLDSDGASSPFTLSKEGTATTITITAADSDGDPITYIATADANFNGLATVTGSGNEFTITPLSQDSATTESGSITFKATDGINISSSVGIFTLLFVSPLWDETALSIGTSSTNSLDNSTFIDRSTNAHTVTAPNGNPIQTAFHPYLDNWSVEFDGSNYFTAPSDTSFDIGTGDFTFECWVYKQTNNRIMLQAITGAGLSISINTSGNIEVNRTQTAIDFTFTAGIVSNTWTHIAITRSGTDLRAFKDGVLLGTQTSTTDYGQGVCYVGVDGNGVSSRYIGFISDFRLIKGTAVYTANFTPSTGKLTAVSGTSLLTCQSNRFIDNSTNGHVITGNSNPEISAFNPFGQPREYAVGENKGSVFLDETSSEYLISELTTLDNVDATWTIECWAYPTADGSPEYVIGFNNKAGGNDYIIGVTASFIAGVSFGAQPIIDVQWNHVALASDGTNVRLFINGVLEETVTYNASKPISACVAAVGVEFDAPNGAGPGNYFDGYISDWGVSDTCKYTSNFTPPTSPVSADADVLYVPMDNAGIFDKTGNNTLALFGNTSTSTTQTKFANTAMYFDGSGDYIQIDNDSLFNFGTDDFTIETWYKHQGRTGNYPSIISGQAWSSPAGGVGLRFDNLGTSRVQFFWNGVGDPWLSSSSTFTNTSSAPWMHIALTREGNTFRIFVNGTLEASGTNSGSINFAHGGDTFIGWGPWDGVNGYLNAYLENFQILKGVAKYTTNFTPPTQEQGIIYQAES